MIDLAAAGFIDRPELVVGIDGVGTKIEVNSKFEIESEKCPKKTYEFLL